MVIINGIATVISYVSKKQSTKQTKNTPFPPHLQIETQTKYVLLNAWILSGKNKIVAKENKRVTVLAF